MTHVSSHIIISNAAKREIDNLPEEKREQIEAILERANKEVEEILEG